MPAVTICGDLIKYQVPITYHLVITTLWGKYHYILIKHMRNQMVAIRYVCSKKTRAGIMESYTWKLRNFVNQMPPQSI